MITEKKEKERKRRTIDQRRFCDDVGLQRYHDLLDVYDVYLHKH
jgi:hypothetical protein